MLLVVGVPASVLLLCVALLALSLALATPTPTVLWIPHAYRALGSVVSIGAIAVLMLISGLGVAYLIEREP